MAALRVWWRAWRHLRHRGYVYVWANLCFVVVALPVITAPAGFAGLVKLSRALQRGERADLNTFWSGLRESLGRGMVLSLLTLLVLVVNGSNLIAYDVATVFDVSLRLVWLFAIGLWLWLMFIFFPLAYAMGAPTILGVLRNGLLLVARHPFRCLTHGVGLLALALLSAVLPFLAVLLTFSFGAIVSVGAVDDCLAKAGAEGQAV